MAADRRFRAMGTDVHLVVHGPEEFADQAQARVEELEQRWSRFLPDSEVTRLNEHAGSWTEVSPETVLLVRRALEGHDLTGGRFDPTVLGDLERAGYDRSFDLIGTQDHTAAPAEPTARHRGAAGIQIDAEANRVLVPAGVGFDPGGIGKGLAADLVAEDLMAAGSAGALINIGGDLRAVGVGPDGDDWHVQLDPAASGAPVAGVLLREGAVATSTVLRRRWEHDGLDRHHLIDPTSGEPVGGSVESVSVLAARGWQAEILAKAVLVAGADEGLALVESLGADALVIEADGTHRTTPGFARFLVAAEEETEP